VLAKRSIERALKSTGIKELDKITPAPEEVLLISLSQGKD
jgi:hypothetical protein